MSSANTSSTTPATPPALWYGWARRGSRGTWRRLVTALTDVAALEAVRRLTATWQHVDIAVLPAGRDPSERP